MKNKIKDNLKAGIFRVTLNGFLITVKANNPDEVGKQFGLAPYQMYLSIRRLNNSSEDLIVDLDLTDETEIKFRKDWLSESLPFKSSARINFQCKDCIEKSFSGVKKFYCINPFVRMMAARVDKNYQLLTGCCRRFPKQFLEALTLKQKKKKYV